MDELIAKAMEQLVANGPFGILVAVMVYRDFRRDKRIDLLTDKLVSISEDTAEALTAIKERIK